MPYSEGDPPPEADFKIETQEPQRDDYGTPHTKGEKLGDYFRQKLSILEKDKTYTPAELKKILQMENLGKLKNSRIFKKSFRVDYQNNTYTFVGLPDKPIEKRFYKPDVSAKHRKKWKNESQVPSEYKRGLYKYLVGKYPSGSFSAREINYPLDPNHQKTSMYRFLGQLADLGLLEDLGENPNHPDAESGKQYHRFKVKSQTK